jgi:outer membrane protein assembly factor BamB
LLVSTGRGRIAAIDPSKIEYSFERAFRFWRQQFYVWGLQEDPPVLKGHVWGRRLGGDVAVSSSAIADGVAYVASADGRVHAMAISDGELLWSYDAGAQIHTSAAVAGGRVYVGTDDGDVLALDRANGTLVQRMPMGHQLYGLIVVTDDELYVTSSEPGVLICIR